MHKLKQWVKLNPRVYAKPALDNWPQTTGWAINEMILPGAEKIIWTTSGTNVAIVGGAINITQKAFTFFHYLKP